MCLFWQQNLLKPWFCFAISGGKSIQSQRHATSHEHSLTTCPRVSFTPARTHKTRISPTYARFQATPGSTHGSHDGPKGPFHQTYGSQSRWQRNAPPYGTPRRAASPHDGNETRHASHATKANAHEARKSPWTPSRGVPRPPTCGE